MWLFPDLTISINHSCWNCIFKMVMIYFFSTQFQLRRPTPEKVTSQVTKSVTLQVYMYHASLRLATSCWRHFTIHRARANYTSERYYLPVHAGVCVENSEAPGHNWEACLWYWTDTRCLGYVTCEPGVPQCMVKCCVNIDHVIALFQASRSIEY